MKTRNLPTDDVREQHFTSFLVDFKLSPIHGLFSRQI